MKLPLDGGKLRALGAGGQLVRQILRLHGVQDLHTIRVRPRQMPVDPFDVRITDAEVVEIIVIELLPKIKSCL